jgi:acyl-CoA dehydrogenase
MSLIEHLLTAPPASAAASDVDGWWRLWSAELGRFPQPIEAAIAGGLAADRLGFAFAAGYHAALSSLVPALAQSGITALCATEEGGAHPRAIQTRLDPAPGGFTLSGRKRWSTLAPRARQLLVLASTGTGSDGRSLLRLARVPTNAAGVRIQEMPAPPFAPEIPHAELELESVHVGASSLLEGDAWQRYVKPFRTLEDVHVHGALIGYLIGVARRAGWPEAEVERWLALAVAMRALAAEPPDSPALHVALAGLLDATRQAVQNSEPHWQAALVDPAERDRWQRDRPLLEVAGKARAARSKRAWQEIRG